MAPSVNPSNTTFSQCSLDAIVPRSRNAACITGLTPADLSVAADLGTTRRAVGRAFDLAVTITNIGGSEAVDTSAEIIVPPSVIIDDAFVAGGTCTSGGGVIACVWETYQPAPRAISSSRYAATSWVPTQFQCVPPQRTMRSQRTIAATARSSSIRKPISVSA